MAEEAEAEVEEEEDEECPKCPPVGAPAWMATFADMATLLMAFFVLILSFAEFNVPKFKQISGSLKNAFGVQRLVPVVEQPKGTTVLTLNFSPSPSPSVTKEMTQDTTTLEQPELEVKNKDGEGEGESEGAEDLVKALNEAIARGDIEVESLGDNVVVNFSAVDAEEKDLPNLLKETLEALKEAKEATGKAETEVLFGGLEQKLEQLAAAAEKELEKTGGSEDQDNKGEGPGGDTSKKAEIAEDKLQVALKQEIAMVCFLFVGSWTFSSVFSSAIFMPDLDLNIEPNEGGTLPILLSDILNDPGVNMAIRWSQYLASLLFYPFASCINFHSIFLNLSYSSN